jgi:hypothetical protein
MFKVWQKFGHKLIWSPWQRRGVNVVITTFRDFRLFRQFFFHLTNVTIFIANKQVPNLEIDNNIALKYPEMCLQY